MPDLVSLLCTRPRAVAAPAAQQGNRRGVDVYMGQLERPLRSSTDPRLLPGSKHFIQVAASTKLSDALVTAG